LRRAEELAGAESEAPPAPPADVSGAAPSAMNGGWQDLIIAFKNDLDTAKRAQGELSAMLTRTPEDLNGDNERLTGLLRTLAEKFEQLTREVDAINAHTKQLEERVERLEKKVGAAH